MVFCARSERENQNGEELLMAMVTERSSKPLHNFTLPHLKWGHQRYLRCMKVDDHSSAAADDHRPRRRSSQFDDAGRHRKEKVLVKSILEGNEEAGIEAVREKIMNDLKTAADKMKDAILREEVHGEEDTEKESSVAAAAGVESEARPWNLRTRRAACKAPIGGPNKGFNIEEKKPNSSPIKTDVGAKSPWLLRGEKETKKERPKFTVNLLRKEIEEDFMEMLGHRPPRRPKKRARIVQKQLDTLFPGLWLTEVSVDSYKVPQLAENGKR